MILSKTYCFLIVVLVYNIKQIIGGKLNKANQKCSDAIKEHFLAKKEHPDIKSYCKHALYNFRLSETPENNTFIDPANGEHNMYAEEYYKWLFNFIKIGSKMKTSEEYCKSLEGYRGSRFRSKFAGPFKKTAEEHGNLSLSRKKAKCLRSACLEELSSVFGNENRNINELFQWMYYNLTLDEIQRSEFLQEYMKHIVAQFQIEGKQLYPGSFCIYHYNHNKE